MGGSDLDNGWVSKEFVELVQLAAQHKRVDKIVVLPSGKLGASMM